LVVPEQRRWRTLPGEGQAVAPLQLMRAAMQVGAARVLIVVDVIAFVCAAALVGNLQASTTVLLVTTLVLFGYGGLYRSRLSLSVLDDIPAILGRALVAGAIATALNVVIDGKDGLGSLYNAGLFALLTITGRGIGYAAVRHGRRSGLLTHRTLILGGGHMAGELAQTLLDHPECGLSPVGFLDDDPLLTPEQRPVPHLGGNQDLAGVLTEFDVRNVVVAFGSTREPAVVDMLRACDRLACEIFFIPRLYEVHAVSRDMELVWGIPLVRLRRAAFRTHSWRLKRAMDVALSALALLLLTPVLAVCAVLVRFEIGSPILFRQERVGLDGRAFRVLKFCSLKPVDSLESAVRWNVANDDRIGPVGRVLRRTSLDELPQLWNILRGDMSLVGPRPERPHFVNEFTHQFPRYMARHRVPAGLTGRAQVHGLRGDTSISDRARFDNHYIENWSLWEDSKIILRTAGQLVRAAGR
jgi:exopolysaccharide biosynthesis polyprenyl glycosylphosphotransferase